jgi:Ribbon-helix-helix protein, copG family
VVDILIRDVPDDVVAAIDAKAQRAGLSRTEYIRRCLLLEQSDTAHKVHVEDLAAFTQTFADLDDPDVMGRAWSSPPG